MLLAAKKQQNPVTGRILGAAGSLALVTLIVFPLLSNSLFFVHLGITLMLQLLLAVGLHLMLRTGIMSMAQGAFMGVGAYSAALVTRDLGLPFLAGFAVATVLSGLLAWGLGIITLRMRGTYVLLATFAFNEVLRLIIINWKSLTGGHLGIGKIPKASIGLMGTDFSVTFATRQSFYYLVLGVTLLAVGYAIVLIRSQFGRTADAIRGQELLSECCGINTVQFRLVAFGAGSVYAGWAGVLHAHYLGYVSPDMFTFWQSFDALTYNVVGGMTTIAGPIVGTLALVLGPELIRGLQQYYRLVYGVALMAAMFFMREGIAGVMGIGSGTGLRRSSALPGSGRG